MDSKATAVTIEEESDDYVVIDFVRSHDEATPSSSPVPSSSPCASPVKTSTADSSSLDSGYEEFVIVEEPVETAPAGTVSEPK